ncbi:DUF2797 domain-containing protein [Streptacidiphilus griseoplanus]|uniref:DUF2797 domain-containing protein n=1 Tax=Peterkaempfera griseoplana TaxID=66896 RepID=UPI0006E2A1E8|nr:DUF2797 domain-containing protein [Peterkaempfera griseoplana]
MRESAHDTGELWWSTGVRWHHGRPALGWYHRRHGERLGAWLLGAELAFTAGVQRRCLGVRRSHGRLPCPSGAVLPPTGTRAQCASCSALDRSRSVAADTVPDDPQPYHLYLAYFTAGLVKVGISAVARGTARLLEQGAIAHLLIGRGPLMATRRAEAVLGAALGLPDHVRAEAKRPAREGLPPVAERLRELTALGARCHALSGWPEALHRLPGEPADHSAAYGLEPGGAPAVDGRVVCLAEGSGVAGVVRAVVGPDVYLDSDRDSRLLLDGRHLAGWPLRRDPSARTDVPLARAAEPPSADQPQLF